MTTDLTTVRALLSPAAIELADRYSVFGELETVLLCCERLVTEITTDDAASPEPATDDVAGDDPGTDDEGAARAALIEALWTLALLSYARCFAPAVPPASGRLTAKDLAEAQPDASATEWHDVLLRLRAHHAHERLNPREEFAVGAAQDGDGRAVGIAVTSRHQPRVDLVTVRQTGALAYALRQVVGRRISESEEGMLSSVAGLKRPDLDALTLLDVDPPG